MRNITAKRIFSLFIILSILSCIYMPVSAITEKSDIETHWAKPYIEALNQEGIMNGNGKEVFRPNDPVTRAEFASMVNRAFGFVKDADKSFSDVKPTDWFAQSISIAATQGYLKGTGGGKASPNGNLTREQAMAVFARILKLSPTSEITGHNDRKTVYKDEDKISEWARDTVLYFLNEGYINGANGFLYPGNDITRGEVAAIICRVMGKSYNKAGEYDGKGETVDGNVTIAVSGVTLKNMTINGNLYITEGVGDGTVKLDNVVVEGKTLISGGGINSVIIVNTQLGPVQIEVPDGSPVRFAAQGNSSISSVLILTESIIDSTEAQNSISTKIIALPEDATVELRGNFGTVEVQSPGCNITAKDGFIDELVISSTARSAEVTLEPTTSVGSMLCDAQCSIYGSGMIESAIVNVNRVSIAQKPNSLTFPKGVSVDVAGRLETKSYSSASTSDAGAGSGGPGSSNPDENNTNPVGETTYNLTVAANPENAATLQGGGIYKAGASVTLNAKPIPGWVFRNWTVDGRIVGTSPRLVYVMPQKDVTIVANIVPTYKLTVTASPANAGEVSKSGNYASGSILTVTASAKEGYVFDHWEVNGEIKSVDESFTYFMPASDSTFTAVFLPENTKDTWDGTIGNVIFTLTDGSYLITTGKQLAWLADQVNSGKNDFKDKKFKLGNNIDLNNIPWTPIGKDVNHVFKGTFNGNNKTISNLNVELDSGLYDAVLAGLFGCVAQEGKIQKLKLENVNVIAEIASNENAQTYNYAGGLAAINEGEISNCAVLSGSITSQNANMNYAGGLVGWNLYGTIKASYNLAGVTTIETGAAGGIAGESEGKIQTSFNEGKIEAKGNGFSNAGGIVGYSRNSEVTNCFNTTFGTVAATGKNTAIAGGITGNCDLKSKITASYNTGAVTASATDTDPEAENLEAAGGIAGFLPDEPANIKNCYFMTTTANDGIGDPAGSPSGKTTMLSSTAMENQASFNGFDFNKIWYYRPVGEYAYPHLQVFSSSFKLTVKALPSEGGTASVDDNAGQKFMPGAIVPLVASANPGYHFINWTVNGMPLNEETSFNYKMPSSNVTITANFAADDPEIYMLSADADPEGGGTVSGAGSYLAGETAQLTAIPSEDYIFVSWVGITEEGIEEIGTTPELSFTMPAEDVQLTAVFKNTNRPEYELTILTAPDGYGKVSLQKSHVFNKYEAGTELQLIARANDGYEFVNWSMNGTVVGTHPVFTFNMPEEDTTITAYFEEADNSTPQDYVLTVIPNYEEGGSISWFDGEAEGSFTENSSISLTEGSFIHLTALPNDGYEFINWTINDVEIGTNTNFIYEMPDYDVTITANFEYFEPVTEEPADLKFSGNQIYDFACNDDLSVYVGVGEKGSVILYDSQSGNCTQHWSGINAVAVAYGNGRYVAVGDKVTVSTDGINWEIANLSATGDEGGSVDITNISFNDIVFGITATGSGKFVALASNSNGQFILTSSNGLTWSVKTAPEGARCYEAAAGGGSFVIIGDNDIILVSDNGTSWTAATPLPGGRWSKIASGNDMYLILGYESGKRMMASGTNMDWTVSEYSMPDGHGFAAFNNLFFLNGNFYATSTTMGDWVYKKIGNSFSKVEWKKGVKGAGDTFFSVTEYGGLEIKTIDNGSWQIIIEDNPYDFENMYYKDGVYILTGSKKYYNADMGYYRSGVAVTSTDNGSTWNAYEMIQPAMMNTDMGLQMISGEMRGVAFNGTKFVAIGGRYLDGFEEDQHIHNYLKSFIYTSTDTENWDKVRFGLDVSLYDVAGNEEIFVAVGNSRNTNDHTYKGRILTSADGENWTVRAVNIPELYTVSWDENKQCFFAAGYGNSIYASQDGENWTEINVSGTPVKIFDLAGNIAAGEIFGYIDINGTFVPFTMPSNQSLLLSAAGWGDGCIYVSGSDGFVGCFDGEGWLDGYYSGTLADLKSVAVTGENGGLPQLRLAGKNGVFIQVQKKTSTSPTDPPVDPPEVIISRELPVLCYDSDMDRYLCVYKRYDSEYSSEYYHEQHGIYGRFIAADASYIGEEIQLYSSLGIGSFSKPGICYDSVNKRFLVAWEKRDDIDNNSWNIFGRFISSDGVPVSEVFPISDLNDSKDQTYPWIAFDSVNSNCLVVYRQMEHLNSQQDDLHCRLVMPDGNLGEDRLIAGGLYSQWCTSLDFTGDSFYVSYHDDSGDSPQIKAKTVNTNGIPEESFQLLYKAGYEPPCGGTIGDAFGAYDFQSEKLILTWESRYVNNQWIDDLCGKFAGRDGTAGNIFVIADNTELMQFNPSVAASGGNFTVVWQEPSGDGSYVIKGATVNADNGTVSLPFDVSSDISFEVNPDDSPSVCTGITGTEEKSILVAYSVKTGINTYDIAIKALQ